MKNIYKKLALVTSLLFTISIIGLAYYLFVFPERIANKTHLISLMDVPQLQPVLQELYVFVGISILLGFVSILLHLARKGSQSENNVVYIEKFKEKKDQKKSSSEQEEDKVEEHLQEINSALKKEEDVKKKAEKVLSFLADKLEASQAAIYKAGKKDGKNVITLFAAYAFVLPESQTVSYEFGEGLAGQVAKEQKLINISEIPEGYIKILSGLGESDSAHLIVSPITREGKILGVAEIASFKKFSKKDEALVTNALALISKDLEARPTSDIETK